jgi:hypothetical protein
MEAFLLVVSGQLGVWPMIADLNVPVLSRNIVGGTALFVALSIPASLIADVNIR